MIICVDRRNLRKDKPHWNTPPIWALWRCGQTQSSPQWRCMETHLEFAKMYYLVWWTSIPSFMLERKQALLHHMQSTIPKVKCAGSSFMLWGCFSAAGTGRLVRVEGKLNAAKYINILNKNLFHSALDLRLGRRFNFQHDSDPKRTAKATQQWLRDNSVNVLEWLSQSPDLNPIEHLWRGLKMAVHQQYPSWLSLRGFAKKNGRKIPNPSGQSLLIPKRLEAIIAAKGASTKYIEYLLTFQFIIFNKFTDIS